jgi:hypothetical protein
MNLDTVYSPWEEPTASTAAEGPLMLRTYLLKEPVLRGRVNYLGAIALN